MFWIHGGAFYLGDGNLDSFSPEYFMDKDIVMITLNYRLGALGKIDEIKYILKHFGHL